MKRKCYVKSQRGGERKLDIEMKDRKGPKQGHLVHSLADNHV